VQPDGRAELSAVAGAVVSDCATAEPEPPLLATGADRATTDVVTVPEPRKRSMMATAATCCLMIRFY
jgi:hypothetical protein